MVQTAAIVCVAGCVAAMAIPAFARALRLSKIAEAAENLEQMHLGAAAYYAAERHVDGERAQRCLPPPAGPTPATPGVDPLEVSWRDPELVGVETWTALGFAPSRDVRFSYTFEPVAHGCGLRSPPGAYLVTFRARGDLDGDGERSIFERRATASEGEAALVPIGIFYVRDRVE